RLSILLKIFSRLNCSLALRRSNIAVHCERVRASSARLNWLGKLRRHSQRIDRSLAILRDWPRKFAPAHSTIYERETTDPRAARQRVEVQRLAPGSRDADVDEQSRSRGRGKS